MNRTHPRPALWVSALMIFSSCASSFLGTAYKYDYGLQQSTQSSVSGDTMRFEDSTILVTFKIDELNVNFDLLNKTGDTLTVEWEDARMNMGLDAQRVMHKGLKMNQKDKPRDPSKVAPHARLVDFAYPASNAYWTGDQYISPTQFKFGKWEQRELFTKYDLKAESIRQMIMDNKGKRFTLALPIASGGAARPYVFEFVVKDVRPVVK
ncbi:MAG: hypothetical protein WAU70_01215 [Flavobacteriales bacterium]